MTSRYETPFQITLNHDQTRHLTANGQSRDRQQLIVRVPDDSLYASWPPNNSFDHPPSCTARLESQPDGVRLTGTIRQARANVFFVRIWLIPMFAMLAVSVGAVIALIAGNHGGVGGLLLGGIGTILFALMWRWYRHTRRPDFDSDSKRLADGLTRYLTTGDGARQGW